MAGYLTTAKRKAAIKRWQAAGAAARKRKIKKGFARLDDEKYIARANKIYKGSEAKLAKLTKSGKTGGRAVAVIKGTMKRAVFNIGFKRNPR